MHKKNRSIQEKILDCLDNHIKNLHPDLRSKLIKELENLDICVDVSKCKLYVSRLLNLPTYGKQSRNYWIARGWNKAEAKLKAKEHSHKNNGPYSIEFWTNRINPKTGLNYTYEEAEYERNSRICVKKEYWMKQGYSEDESIQLAIDAKRANDKKGGNAVKQLSIEEHKISSPRCKEYWMVRGHSEEEANNLVSNSQATFSLKKCIEKYGKTEGTEIWNQRQIKWQNTLNSKSDAEKEEINRKKVSTLQRILENPDDYSNITCKLYLIEIYSDDEKFYKIGITTKDVETRFKKQLNHYQYKILNLIEGNLIDIVDWEQRIIENNSNICYTPKVKFAGWTECFYEEPIINC